MSYSNDFKRFEFDFKFAQSSKYVPLSKKDFIAILYYIELPDELQVIFFSVLCTAAQITVKLIKLITTANLPISYEDLARELSIDKVLIKLRLSDLYQSGFPIELTEINVRMKTQAEFKHKKKPSTR
jgi:hypothetical protein